MLRLSRGKKSQIHVTGKHSYGIENISIKSWDEGADLFIGSFCSIAANQTIFLGGNHRADWATTYPFGFLNKDIFPLGAINGAFDRGNLPSTKGHVVIHNDVWIGDGCTIMSGIEIGSGSIIAAKSVVVKNVPPYTIVGGNPAKHIRSRFNDDIIKSLLEIQWWNLEDAVINEICPLLQSPLDTYILTLIKDILSRSSRDMHDH